MANHNSFDIDAALKQLNLRLKGANIRVSIVRKGGSLYARATLPPPPDSDKLLPYQQHLSLQLKANPIGLKRAEAEAKKIGAALDLKEFSWANYGRGHKQADNRTVADWIAAFEENYFDNTQRNPTTEYSFKVGYSDFFKRLPQDQVLTREILERVIKATTPNSSPRSRMCYAFRRLGIFAELDVSFITKELSGSYSSSKPAPRDLPSDELIVEWFNKIPNPAWRWVYGMVAAYGLRPHEVFHLDTKEIEQGGCLLKVLENTKTGYREVRPFHPEWVDQFGLRQPQLPKVTGKTNHDLGSRVKTAFGRYKIPFPAYNLRHRYAVRCIEFDLNVSLAARWMGHTVTIHTKTYQAWLSKPVEEKAFERVLNNPNRPQPPIMQELNQSESGQSEVA
ncbi:site-specific integrase [Funiculus sociatus GB2-M2]|uniref:site-specific integrase n=1 Tax=Funiculus sociatus TaxID=450527 RepID=UPI0032971F45